MGNRKTKKRAVSRRRNHYKKRSRKRSLSRHRSMSKLRSMSRYRKPSKKRNHKRSSSRRRKSYTRNMKVGGMEREGKGRMEIVLAPDTDEEDLLPTAAEDIEIDEKLLAGKKAKELEAQMKQKELDAKRERNIRERELKKNAKVVTDIKSEETHVEPLLPS